MHIRLIDVAAATIVAASIIAAVFAPDANATPAPGTSTVPQNAIVTADQTALRAAPRDSAQQQAQLWQGEVVEVRGERMDYVQVWDHRRERGGYIRASQLRRLSGTPADAPELLSVVRFLRDTSGKEALGISMVAAWLQAAPAVVVNSEAGTEALSALGGFADRLAVRASSNSAGNRNAETTLAAHLEVAAQYGVKFNTYERDGRMQICYDGEALRRVLATASRPEQRAQAALALTRPECVDARLGPIEANRMDEWRADVLDRVDVATLSPYLRNRVQMRRAGLWSGLAYQRTRLGGGADVAARRALDELAGVNKSELPDEDIVAYNDAAMRVNASRWAAESATSTAPAETTRPTLPTVVTVAGEAGETCVLLVDGKHGVKEPLARRCTYGVVWANSFSRNREANAAALAVQPLAGWRELWLFRKDADGWSIAVLPPNTVSPEVGYIEFAGWVPGGKQVLVAREARGEGKYKRNFELLSLASLAPERQASDPAILGAFQRWQDPSWKRTSVSLR